MVGISDLEQSDFWRVLAAILHLGNIEFVESGNYACVRDAAFLEFPAYLLGVNSALLNEKLTTRMMESRWGGQSETTVVTLTVEQDDYAAFEFVEGTRDAHDLGAAVIGIAHRAASSAI